MLYHGTSERHVESILKAGLSPRGSKLPGNWEHTIKSNERAVYLTDAYGLYFAWAASDDDARLAVIEVDSDTLDLDRLCADEDVIEQANRNRDELPAKWTMERRNIYYRNRMRNYCWKRSLELMGTCAHIGKVKTSAIKRIALVDKRTYYGMMMRGHDPSISIMNYRIIGDRYRAVMTWLFEPHKVQNQVVRVGEHEIHSLPLPDDREGITILRA